SVAIIGLISLYSKAILGKVRKHIHWLIAGLLSVLYGYLYVLLQLEDLSLLFGAIGLLVVVAIVMYVTRNINWYGDTQQT
ncbi:MAG: cell envelope integrity protein CreD, partial [Vampirovibrio sp.]|nr:cell envelope integrity protein CreD [Vampirovibrio sp.]